jgi:magnesium-dependent phosphatase 1
MRTDPDHAIRWAPALVVFDLDFTLWDCGGTWCDCLRPPFHAGGRGEVKDGWGSEVTLYPDILEILDALDRAGVPAAVASRTQEPTWADELLRLLGVHHRFAHHEIYPTRKTRHFASLRSRSGVPFEEMVFFDDEHRNIVDVSALGVRCNLVSRGVDWDAFACATGGRLVSSRGRGIRRPGG